MEIPINQETNLQVHTLFGHGSKFIDPANPEEIDYTNISDTNYYFLSIIKSGEPLKMSVGYIFQLALQSDEFVNKFIEPVKFISQETKTFNSNGKKQIPSKKTFIKNLIIYGLYVLVNKITDPNNVPIVETPLYFLYWYLKLYPASLIYDKKKKTNSSIPVETLNAKNVDLTVKKIEQMLNIKVSELIIFNHFLSLIETDKRLIELRKFYSNNIKYAFRGIDFLIIGNSQNLGFIDFLMTNDFFKDLEYKLYYRGVPNRELNFIDYGPKHTVKLGLINTKSPNFNRVDYKVDEKIKLMKTNNPIFLAKHYSEINEKLTTEKKKSNGEPVNVIKLCGLTKIALANLMDNELDYITPFSLKNGTLI